MTKQKQAQIGTVARVIIPALVAYLAGRGLLTPEEGDALAPLIATIAAALVGIWSIFASRKTTATETPGNADVPGGSASTPDPDALQLFIED